MSHFQNYSTEYLIQIGSNESGLNQRQLTDLLHELESRRQQIEDELVDIGVPANIIRDPQKKLEFKKQALLDKIDRLL